MLRYRVHWMSALVIVLMGAVATGIASPVPQPIKGSAAITRSVDWQSLKLMLMDWKEGRELVIKEFERTHGSGIASALNNELGPLEDEFEPDIRSKRYALLGGRWNVTDFTYRISKYSKQLDRSTVDKEIARAFGVWSEHTDLTFTSKDTGTVDIEIKFVENDHGDGNPFDGPNGTIAHFFYPTNGGDVHFDDAEEWTSNTSKGVNLFQLAVHVFGHVLGLDFSDVQSSVMSEFGTDIYDPNFRLDSDDIKGIQALYGEKTPSLCKSPKIDTIFNDNNGNTYVFKGDKYYKLTGNGVAEGYPKKISDGWPKLSSNIDAAFTYKNGKTFFFKGSKFWRYDGRQLDDGYPKEISEGFDDVPNYLNAAMAWGAGGKIFFFKGSEFWLFDPQKHPAVDRTYPKPVSDWKGVPDSVDAAFMDDDGYIYLFKEDKYFKFDGTMFTDPKEVSSVQGLTAKRWFGC